MTSIRPIAVSAWTSAYPVLLDLTAMICPTILCLAGKIDGSHALGAVTTVIAIRGALTIPGKRAPSPDVDTQGTPPGTTGAIVFLVTSLGYILRKASGA